MARETFPRYDSGITEKSNTAQATDNMSITQTEEELERCTLSSRREIIFQTRNLIRQKARVAVTFDEGRRSFLTLLIDLSEDKDMLYFDIGGSDETNQAFLKSQRCQFSAVVEGIRIQFAGRDLRQTKLDGEPVLATALPKTMLRLQRRDAFRLQLPTTKPYICRIRRGSPAEQALPIYDISVGGIGIQITEEPQVEAAQHLENCWLDLRESGLFSATLEVRYITHTESRLNKPIWHIGCQFINLSPANETLIQRFMAKIEVERRALSAG